jgi:hypothetical protein
VSPLAWVASLQRSLSKTDERAEHRVSRRSDVVEQPSAEQAAPESKVSSLSDSPTDMKAQRVSELMIGAAKHLGEKEHQEAKQVWTHNADASG